MSFLKVLKELALVKWGTMIFFLVMNFFTPSHPDELRDLGFKESVQFGVFYSLQTILDTLDEKRFQSDPRVHQMLTTFDQHCRPRRDKPLSPRRPYPFIVIEGAQRTGRRILGKTLAKSIGAKVVGGVPRSMIRLRYQFENESNLKRLFFGLCNYVTAFNVRHMLEHMPVVLIGYWMDQATFNIAKECRDGLPPSSSFIYQFPADLLKPDLIFYLNTPRDDEQGNFVDQEFNQRIPEVYRNLRDPSVVEVQSKYITDEFINDLRIIVRDKLQNKFPHLIL